MTRKFKIGDRVLLKGHWEFPDGTIGTISVPGQSQLNLANPGEWNGHLRTVKGRKGPILFYFVNFDQPADDGSGDGPYFAAEIDADSLLPHD